ncbi:MAG: hypothetical protein C0613_15315 [Desulfobulbaceae bacterium]|nr:MAG: hypothetical protein C0613_15315 [Desulfobulbaceae bacterium]
MTRIWAAFLTSLCRKVGQPLVRCGTFLASRAVAVCRQDRCGEWRPTLPEKIMVLIGQLSCQLKDIKEVAKIYRNFAALPAHIGKAGPYFRIRDKKGLQALTIYRVEGGDLAAAHDYLLERYKPFAGVPSVSYSVTGWQDLSEALETLRNMGPPIV